MIFDDYFKEIEQEFKTGRAREHSYRPALKNLLESLQEKIVAQNEPSRIECGAPDYIISRKKNPDLPIAFIEAKDLNQTIDLNKVEKDEQLRRYRSAMPNLILTNYLEFRLFRNGDKVQTIKLGEIKDSKIIQLPENYKSFSQLIEEFCNYQSITVTSPEKLAQLMSGKAKIIDNVIFQALIQDKKEKKQSSLQEQLNAFKEILIDDIDEKQFADVYAQTIAYGMFAARLHDRTLETFSRQEAAELIPKSNPFLRKLFQYIAGYDLDERLIWIVDSLVEVFRATDIKKLLENFGSTTQRNDPIIHFYETFLKEYDPKLRKSRGVYYTPEPVVSFIVKAVDQVLKSDFGLKDGLADTSKTEIKVRNPDNNKEEKFQVHKVQILDPATGTGTFLAEVIKYIYNSRFKGQQGIWRNYVDQDLIPRLNGFEILMASYAMCHLKLDLLLQETGYKTDQSKERFNVFLTNALEEAHPKTRSVFATWLSAEALEANRIKRETPVMVVIGNPPYSVSSSNKGEWIQELIKSYKKGLNEKKINLDDDYIKFIRYAQYFIKKNGQGIIAMITNNSFVDGITHRQMRKELDQTFDKIYILDLHGNSKKQEKAPDGSNDENVFDIMQGVSICIMVKKEL